MGTRLYVGNLSFDTMRSDFNDLFAQVGTIVKSSLIADRYAGKSRGFAFGETASDEESQKAIAEIGGKTVDGRPLTINEAKPREERPRRNFDGGGGRSR